MKRLMSMLFLCVSIALHGAQDKRPLRVLHLSFHRGCVNDIQEVADELGFEVTSWFILAPELPREHFDGVSTGNAVYNISAERADVVWHKHKKFFDTFDAIITSDTAPLSRIFLQNEWLKPLIIWICNRFDYCDWQTYDGTFPDRDYYGLFADAYMRSNVHVVGYTPYEHFYARQKGVETGDLVIKPLGSHAAEVRGGTSAIPQSIDKEDTVFIYPRVYGNELAYVEQQCHARGIATYSGRYNGPEDLTAFKGVIYFPYAWSNLAPFENFHRGVVHFVPSEKFILEEVARGNQVKHITLDQFHLIEWYFPEYRDVMVYFDSWDDLQHKLTTTDYAALRSRINAFGVQHKSVMLQRWAEVFDACAAATGEQIMRCQRTT